ncbi:rhodopsin-like [Tachypleus tridentatus]|uniref:rhodopsin-like n=1 Tax=Tachypleus tridentatus TaxID=6853 RepID=UPI003FD6283E
MINNSSLAPSNNTLVEKFTDIPTDESSNHDTLLEPLSDLAYNVASSLLFVIALFGFLNNLVVIFVILRNKHLQNPFNCILLNMSSCDMTISVMGTPLTFVAAVHRKWIFGDAVCKIYGFGMSVVGMTAIGTLTATSIERYIIMSRPYNSSKMSPRRSCFIVICTWIYSLSLCLPPFFGWSRYVLEPPGISCSVDWMTETRNNKSYIIYLFITGFFLPVFVMIFCYSQIIRRVRKVPKMRKKSNHAHKAQQRLTIMVGIMIICTLTAWTPYAVVSLIVALGYPQLIGPLAAVSPAIFAKSCVVYNPIVYFFLNPQIQEAIMKTFRRSRPEVQSAPQLDISLIATNNYTDVARRSSVANDLLPLRSDRTQSFLVEEANSRL